MVASILVSRRYQNNNNTIISSTFLVPYPQESYRIVIVAYQTTTVSHNSNPLCTEQLESIVYKWVPRVSPPWVDSKLQLQLDPSSQTYHTLRGKTEKICSLFVTVLNMFIFLFFISTTQEIFYWFLPVGVCVQVYKYYINYGVSMAFS